MNRFFSELFRRLSRCLKKTADRPVFDLEAFMDCTIPWSEFVEQAREVFDRDAARLMISSSRARLRNLHEPVEHAVIMIGDRN